MFVLVLSNLKHSREQRSDWRGCAVWQREQSAVRPGLNPLSQTLLSLSYLNSWMRLSKDRHAGWIWKRNIWWPSGWVISVFRPSTLSLGFILGGYSRFSLSQSQKKVVHYSQLLTKHTFYSSFYQQRSVFSSSSSRYSPGNLCWRTFHGLVLIQEFNLTVSLSPSGVH